MFQFLVNFWLLNTRKIILINIYRVSYYVYDTHTYLNIIAIVYDIRNWYKPGKIIYELKVKTYVFV